jgi:dihydrolipoamide dehydrogenase
MLAHKAIPEGRVAAEVISGLKHYFDPKCIPNVAYTDPEIAWVGVSENEAKAKGIKYGKGTFPWAASGRSLSNGRDEGLTKLIIDETTHRVIGAGIVGTNAGELIGEVGLAIEMGCDVEDISLTIHPHPTLSETVAMAAEVFEGTITDLYLPKKKTEDKKTETTNK